VAEQELDLLEGWGTDSRRTKNNDLLNSLGTNGLQLGLQGHLPNRSNSPPGLSHLNHSFIVTLSVASICVIRRLLLDA
jgi:hypothetical protein